MTAATTPRRRRWWGLRWADAGRALLGLAGAALGLLIASWLVPDFSVGTWKHALVAAALILILGAVMRPLLVQGAVLLGWAGAVLVGLFGQAFVIWAVLAQVLSEQGLSLLSIFVASWIVAAVSTLVVWVATAGTDDAVVVPLLRQARRKPAVVEDPEVPGIVFVQADGVPFPVLQWGVRAGTLPTLSRWIRSGSHRMAEWRPMLPATTPASQMGILHGSIAGIPAFRWVDRSDGRVYVANRTGDAAAIEALHSDGHGLLCDDGVSVSNLFTGDATTAYATMSAVERMQENRHTRVTLLQYLAHPTGLSRSLTRAVSEIVRERFQASRAVRRDVRPRVHRGWGFALERAALTGVMNDLNTHLVGEAILSGRHSVYVDYVGYDAIAHHAGVMRPEALAALEGIDAVLRQLEQLIEAAPRPYHLVVLSDHGQSQGEIFADRYGEDLSGLVRRLGDEQVTGTEFNAEGTGTINALVAGSTSEGTVLGRVLTGAADAIARKSRRDHGTVQPTPTPTTGDADDADGFVVFGSGNLGLVYVAGEKHRLRADELLERYPALVAGLVAHPGVGFVVVDTEDHGPVALGPEGENRVREGTVVGTDPLAAFGPDAAGFVLRAATMPEAPDLYVNSIVDELGEVAAFEGLVGCHGGLGGWQDRAMLVWPAELPEPEGTGVDGMVVGADAMHRVLVGWLRHVGHRADIETGPPDRELTNPG